MTSQNMDKLPIETAPKDGTWILLWGGTTGEEFYLADAPPADVRRPVVGKWLVDHNGGAWVMCFWDGNWRTGYEAPSHWSPLA